MLNKHSWNTTKYVLEIKKKRTAYVVSFYFCEFNLNNNIVSEVSVFYFLKYRTTGTVRKPSNSVIHQRETCLESTN
jgi:hypothetical protein